MFLTDEERSARDGDTVVLGVNTYGEDKLTGDLVSCAIILDYTKLTPELINCTLDGNPFTKDMSDNLNNAIRAVYTHSLDALQLNSIADMDTAVYLANYKAITGCVFTCFSKISADPDFIISNKPIKEVVKNKELSIYTNKNSKSNYVVLDKWNQLRSLIPHTRYKQIENGDVFTLMFAKNFAKTLVQKSVETQNTKYPGYTFDINKLTPEQEAFLLKNGMTEYHRAFMPGMEKFAFNRGILI